MRKAMLCWIVLSAAAILGSAARAGENDGYYAGLTEELTARGLPAGQIIIAESESGTMKKFRRYGNQASAGQFTTIEAPEELPFSHARRLKVTERTKDPWGVIWGYKGGHGELKKGDVLLGVLWLRSVGAADAGATSARLVVKGGGKTHGRFPLLPPDTWTKFYFATTLKKNVPADQLKIELFLGYGVQTLEVGGAAFRILPDSVALKDLPQTELTYDYEGRDPDAAWRKSAEKRIEKHRKGDLTIRVVDADGQPIPNAEVRVEMTRHGFLWGNLLAPPIVTKDDEEGRMYRKMLLENFNSVTNGAFKWPAWTGRWRRHKQEDIIAAIDWAREQGLPIHGHTPLWHNYGHMPFQKGRETKEEIRQGIRQWLEDLLTHPKVNGRIRSWDAINHPFAFPAIWRFVGKDLMLEELKLFRKLDPTSQIFVNEGGVMTLSASQYPEFLEFGRWLMENGAPLDGMGFMCHFSATSVTPPEELLKRLDAFAALDEDFPGYDLELKITEYDVAVDREDPEQVELQRDYYRDFLIAAFSHPDVGQIIQWGMWAKGAWKPRAMIFNEDWTLREHGKVYRELVFDRWWTDETLTADDTGQCRVRGFLGEYRITAEKDGKTAQAETTLEKDGKTVTVTIK